PRPRRRPRAGRGRPGSEVRGHPAARFALVRAGTAAGRPASDSYTFLRFHDPRRNTTSAITAIADSAITTDQNTPDSRISHEYASPSAIGISNTQYATALIQVGVAVSPAPFNACTSTMPTAY